MIKDPYVAIAANCPGYSSVQLEGLVALSIDPATVTERDSGTIVIDRWDVEGVKKPSQAEFDAWLADAPPVFDPVPETITSRQFMQQLALEGDVTWDEALAFQSTGELPDIFENAFNQIPEDNDMRKQAIYLFVSATTFDRNNATTVNLIPLLGKTSNQADDLWRKAFKLD